MQRLRWSLGFSVVALGILLLSGCGGGSSSGLDQGTVNLFVTDGFNDQYSQVLITVFKIEVGRQGDPSSYQTIFADPEGYALDVRSLETVAQFLALQQIPAGIYNRARITWYPQVSLTASGGAASNVEIESTSGTLLDDQHHQFEFPISLTVTASGSTILIVDFDLPSFQIVNGKLRPFLKHLNAHEMGNRERRIELEGTILNLKSQTEFDVRNRRGLLFHVQVAPDSEVFSDLRGASVILADGQRVKVKGVLDPMTRTITAYRVRVQDHPQDNDGQEHRELAEVRGEVASLGSGQFTMRLFHAHDFTPSSTQLTVLYNDQTRWVSEEGPSAFADLKVGSKVEVQGSFDPASKQLTATVVEIEGVEEPKID